MALPGAWNQITVEGTFLNNDGSPARGEIHFSAPHPVVFDGVTVIPTRLTAELDENGAFTINLPSTDDPGLDNTTWAFLVTEDFRGGRDPYLIFVPYDTVGTIDLSTVAPAASTPSVTDWRLRDLLDVSSAIGSATDGQALVYNVAQRRWIADTIAGGGGVSDHGALTGLNDDDHTQYHNDARGDIRYAPIRRTHNAAAAVTAGDIVVLRGTEWAVATAATEAGCSGLAGYAENSANIGEPVTALVSGIIDLGFVLLSGYGDVIYVSDTTPGGYQRGPAPAIGRVLGALHTVGITTYFYFDGYPSSPLLGFSPGMAPPLPVRGDLDAAETISNYDLVYINGAGKWALADASAEATAGGALAIAMSGGIADNPLLVATKGVEVTNVAWSWVPGMRMYVSLDAGDLTQAPPSASGEIVRFVGYAVTATKILFDPSPEYLEIA